MVPDASAGTGADAKAAPVLPRVPFLPGGPGRRTYPKGSRLDSRQALFPRGREGLELELEGQGWDNSSRATSNSSDCGKIQGRSRK